MQKFGGCMQKWKNMDKLHKIILKMCEILFSFTL